VLRLNVKADHISLETFKTKIIEGRDIYSIVSEIKKHLRISNNRETIHVNKFVSKFYNFIKRGFDERLSLEFLEDRPIFKIDIDKPYSVFNNMTVIGVDGSSLVFKGHPLRLIITRSAVFSHSQRRINVVRINGVYKVLVRIVDELPFLGDIDDFLRILESYTLSYLESTTINEICKKYGADLIDLVLKDGPLYNINNEGISDMLSSLYKLGIPIIGVVKNSYSKFVTKAINIDNMFDSDFFSFLLVPNSRSPFFMLVDEKSEQHKLVMTYYMTPRRTIMRIEVPYWVYEEYGPDLIASYIAADTILGKGHFSYILSRADKISKFSENEKKILLRQLEKMLLSYGSKAPYFFNEYRWGLHSLRNRVR